MATFSTTNLNDIVAAYSALSGESKQATNEGEPDTHHIEIQNFISVMIQNRFLEGVDLQGLLSDDESCDLTDTHLLAGAGLDKLRALMLGHTRIERISPGHLQSIFASGYMDEWVKAVAAAIAE